MNHPEPAAIRVDVVVLTWNDGHEAAVAVRSASASTGVDPSVWVVDNGSTEQFHVEDPSVHVHRSDVNLGVSRGRRLGVSLGDAPYVCFLDSDAVLSPWSLHCLVAALEDDAGLSCVGPVFEGTPPLATGGRHPTLARKLARAAGLTRTYAPVGPDDGDLIEVDFVIGACQVFRRAAYDEVGGMSDEGLFGPEDVEMCRRLREAGGRVAQVRSTGVDHDARRAWRNPFTKRGARHLVAVLQYYWRRRRG